MDAKESIWTEGERTEAGWIRDLVYLNPFREERREVERKVLGGAWRREEEGRPVTAEVGENVRRVMARAEALLRKGRDRWRESGVGLGAEDRDLYEHLFYWRQFHRMAPHLDEAIRRAHGGEGMRGLDGVVGELRAEWAEWLEGGPQTRPGLHRVEELLAFCFQIRRAFYHIRLSVIGRSRLVEGMRARIWESIFTHDLRRYGRSLFHRMGDIVTLITGPSGSGKELVARGIGLSRYIPFEAARGEFAEPFLETFLPVNLAALSPTLIESELFGHRRGAFTGALQDRKGYFEACGTCGTVFLDEIGEAETSIQVKLLRVLQTRQFQRIGETESRPFAGKAMAATHRDLGAEMRAGRFREDLFYRLCADRVETPALAVILREDPSEREPLVAAIAQRVAGEEEADALTAEVLDWIDRRLGPDYAWPGNFRELEQCVRNILIQRAYHPPARGEAGNGGEAGDSFLRGVGAGNLTLAEVNRGYARRVQARTGNWQETGRVLGVDWRTAKKWAEG